MRIALQAWGSDGDIRPMIALAAGLVRRGHSATISIGSVDNKDYRAMCSAVSVASVRAPETSPTDITQWMASLGRTKNSLYLLRFLHERALFPSFDEMFESAESLLANAELAVGHFLCAPMRVAAAKRGVPYVTTAFWPGLIPDDARPPEGLPNLGRFINRLLWRAGFWLIDRTVAEGYRAFFGKHGQTISGSVMDALYSSRLNLIASSGALWPHAKSERHHRFTGAFTLPSEAESEPLPHELESFVRAGEPPAFLTLGSTGQIDPEISEALLIEAAARSGLRAIIQRDMRRPMVNRATDRLAFTGKTSHAALLPRCSIVLHHGGAGTSHTVLAAGRPAVIVGFMQEQLSWGSALEKSGVARGVFRYGYVSAKALGTALGKAGRDPKLRDRAAELGAQVKAEDGVAEACRQIEAAMSASRP